jgi:hypothetical protein
VSTESDANPKTDQSSANPPAPPPPIDPHDHEMLPNEEHKPADNPINVTVNVPDRVKPTEILQVMVNAALAVIGVVALCIYWGQLNAMKGQLTEIQKQYPQLEKSATAADSASRTAEAAVGISATQFRQDERPYIWSYHVAGTNNVVLPPMGESIYIRVDFKNSGRTPATHVVPTHSITIVAPKMEARREAREFVAKYPVIPGAVMPPELIGTAPTGYGPNLTDTILGDIKNGTWEIYVVGAVKYNDLFQPPIAPYETTYCFSFNPNGLPFGGCDWGGDSFK